MHGCRGPGKFDYIILPEKVSNPALKASPIAKVNVGEAPRGIGGISVEGGRSHVRVSWMAINLSSSLVNAGCGGLLFPSMP